MGLFGHRAEIVFFDGVVIKLSKKHYLIGRATDDEQKKFFNDNKEMIIVIGKKIALRDVTAARVLSRNQGELIWQKDSYAYRNLASKPSKINGEEVGAKLVKLKNEDEVKLPGLRFTYLLNL
ncbi:hypothetical protein KY332_03705 [Candidatus Woesearchaeota archaeon]|nr:hypothetical protein [Candidatus Woesearchaeota archaeon]